MKWILNESLPEIGLTSLHVGDKFDKFSLLCDLKNPLILKVVSTKQCLDSCDLNACDDRGNFRKEMLTMPNCTSLRVGWQLKRRWQKASHATYIKRLEQVHQAFECPLPQLCNFLATKMLTFWSWFGCKQRIACDCVLSALSTLLYFVLSCGSPFLLIACYEAKDIGCDFDYTSFGPGLSDWNAVGINTEKTPKQRQTHGVHRVCRYDPRRKCLIGSSMSDALWGRDWKSCWSNLVESKWEIERCMERGSEILYGHWCFSWNVSHYDHVDHRWGWQIT